jgi:Serine incorporator (Serinc)
MIIGLIGSFFFIIIQLILIVDFAQAWNGVWLSNYEEADNKCWLAGNDRCFDAIERVLFK